MSGNQPDPNPFSREGSEAGDGLGSGPNRFDTWADGSTPLDRTPPHRSGTDPDSSAAPAQQFDRRDPFPGSLPPAYHANPNSASSSVFPTYSPDSDNRSSYADLEPNDEAYAAFRGYQANTPGYPGQGVQPYPGHPAPGVYGRPYGAYGARAQTSPYAVPSFVLGAIGAFCGITGPVGLGLGIAALKQIDQPSQRYSGRGLAIAGIVTGAIGTLWMLLFMLAVLAS